MKKRKVSWTLNAARSLDEYCSFIAQHSQTAARKVRAEILTTTADLRDNAEIYQLDEFRSEGNQNIRRFFRWSYKVVYEVFEDEVIILDVFHTSRRAHTDDD